MGLFSFTSEFSGPQKAVNVWHFQTADDISSLQVSDAIGRIDTLFEAIKAYLWPGTWTHGARVTTVGVLPPELLPSTPLTTTSSATQKVAAQVAAGVTWNTAFLGRSYRGRTFFGPLGTGALDGTGLQLDATFLSTLSTACSTAMTVTTNGAQMCVYSKKLNQGHAVVGNIARGGLRTMRGRLT